MADRYDIVVEDDGAPALVLAGASTIDPDTKSGNPAHEIDSGRFGAGGGRRRGGKPPTRPVGFKSQKGAGPSIDERPDVQRRRDAVVDAARTLDDLTPAGVRMFVRKRWAGTRVLEEADVEAFSVDAKRQRIEDVIDSLDWRIRKGVYGRGAKAVKVDFPRGLARSTLSGLDNTEVNLVLRRLRERGWTSDQVRKHVVRPFDGKDKRMAAELGALT